MPVVGLPENNGRARLPDYPSRRRVYDSVLPYVYRLERRAEPSPRTCDHPGCDNARGPGSAVCWRNNTSGLQTSIASSRRFAHSGASPYRSSRNKFSPGASVLGTSYSGSYERHSEYSVFDSRVIDIRRDRFSFFNRFDSASGF
jgi:hypothetical protein